MNVKQTISCMQLRFIPTITSTRLTPGFDAWLKRETNNTATIKTKNDFVYHVVK